MKENEYVVLIPYTSYVEVFVHAKDEAEAEELALQKAACEDFDAEILENCEADGNINVTKIDN